MACLWSSLPLLLFHAVVQVSLLVSMLIFSDSSNMVLGSFLVRRTFILIFPSPRLVSVKGAGCIFKLCKDSIEICENCVSFLPNFFF